MPKELVWLLTASIAAVGTLHAQTHPLALNETAAQSRPLTLNEAIDLSLKQNRTIAEAQKTTDHYEQLKKEARAQYFPRIQNSSEATYITDREGVDIPAGIFGSPSGIGPLPPRGVHIDQGSAFSYLSRTELIQPLTQLFGIREANRIAQADVRKSTHVEQETRIETVANLHRQFYGVLIARQQLATYQIALIAAQEHLHEEEAMFREGSALASDVLTARSQQSQVEAALVTARTQVRDSVIQLNIMLALPALASTDPQVPPNPEGDAALPSRAEALTIALANEPKLLATQQDVAKARAAVRLAETAYIPDISASAREDYQVGAAFLDRNFGVFSGQLSFQLFDGGRRRAQVNDAKALLAKAELALDEQREQTVASVEVTYDQVEEALVTLKSKQQAEQASAESEREALARFKHGEILPSARDAAVAEHASSVTSVLEARLNVALARVQVQRVLGQVPR